METEQPQVVINSIRYVVDKLRSRARSDRIEFPPASAPVIWHHVFTPGQWRTEVSQSLLGSDPDKAGPGAGHIVWSSILPGFPEARDRVVDLRL